MAGGHLAAQLTAALSEMDNHHSENFVILLANVESQTYRALYALDVESGEVSIVSRDVDLCHFRLALLHHPLPLFVPRSQPLPN